MTWDPTIREFRCDRCGAIADPAVVHGTQLLCDPCADAATTGAPGTTLTATPDLALAT